MALTDQEIKDAQGFTEGERTLELIGLRGIWSLIIGFGSG